MWKGTLKTRKRFLDTGNLKNLESRAKEVEGSQERGTWKKNRSTRMLLYVSGNCRSLKTFTSDKKGLPAMGGEKKEW